MQSAKIVVIEDEVGIAEATVLALEAYPHVNFEAYFALDGEEGLQLAHSVEPDVIILDLELPKINGFQILDTIHKQMPSIKVCVVTARVELSTKLEAFEMGADDYMLKPYASEELLVRISALLRRGRLLQSNKLVCEDLQVIISTRRVYFRTERIHLTKTEFDLLVCFMRQVDQVLSRNELLKEVWHGKNVFPNTVDAHVEGLRSKIDKHFSCHFIRTAYREGYYFSSTPKLP